MQRMSDFHHIPPSLRGVGLGREERERKKRPKRQGRDQLGPGSRSPGASLCLLARPLPSVCIMDADGSLWTPRSHCHRFGKPPVYRAWCNLPLISPCRNPSHLQAIIMDINYHPIVDV